MIILSFMWSKYSWWRSSPEVPLYPACIDIGLKGQGQVVCKHWSGLFIWHYCWWWFWDEWFL